jgi:hypothetical protein
MQDMLRDLRNLDAVKPVPYEPDTPQAGLLRRQVMIATLITIAISLGIIAFGFLVQFLHHAVR